MVLACHGGRVCQREAAPCIAPGKQGKQRARVEEKTGNSITFPRPILFDILPSTGSHLLIANSPMNGG